MSRSSTSDRGQTEPIAALVAISAVALALSLYGVAVVQVLDQDTERNVQDRAIDTVWEDLREDGVYDESVDLPDRIDPERSLPRGYTTQVLVLNMTETGEWEILEGYHYADETWQEITADRLEERDLDPPEESQVATRPIPVREEPGEVYTARLRVEVWR